jgi:hypothetical protein
MHIQKRELTGVLLISCIQRRTSLAVLEYAYDSAMPNFTTSSSADMA